MEGVPGVAESVVVVKAERYDPTSIFIDATTAPEKKNRKRVREKTESMHLPSMPYFVFRSDFHSV